MRRSSSLIHSVSAIVLVFLASVPAVFAQAPEAASATAGGFVVRFGESGLTSLKQEADRYGTDFIEDGRTLGHVRIRCRMTGRPGGSSPLPIRPSSGPRTVPRTTRRPQLVVFTNESGWNDYYADPEVSERFRIDSEAHGPARVVYEDGQ